jgi:hypothetical protein
MHPIGDDAYVFMVSNKHVVEGATGGSFWFTEHDGNYQPIVGKVHRAFIPSFDQCWFGHPSDDIDVAIMPMGPFLHMAEERGHRLYFRAIPSRMLPSDDEVEGSCP